MEGIISGSSPFLAELRNWESLQPGLDRLTRNLGRKWGSPKYSLLLKCDCKAFPVSSWNRYLRDKFSLSILWFTVKALIIHTKPQQWKDIKYFFLSFAVTVRKKKNKYPCNKIQPTNQTQKSNSQPNQKICGSAVYLKAAITGEGVLLRAEFCFGPWYMQIFHEPL